MHGIPWPIAVILWVLDHWVYLAAVAVGGALIWLQRRK